jgi:hypothetical protein
MPTPWASRIAAKLVVVAFRIAPVERLGDQVAVIGEARRRAELVFEPVGDRKIGQRRHRRAQQFSAGDVGGALDADGNARQLPSGRPDSFQVWRVSAISCRAEFVHGDRGHVE